MQSTGHRFGPTSVSRIVCELVCGVADSIAVVRIQFAAPHGILAASLVINRRLYKIASTSSVSSSRAEKRRVIMIDLALGLSIPILTIALCAYAPSGRDFPV